MHMFPPTCFIHTRLLKSYHDCKGISVCLLKVITLEQLIKSVQVFGIIWIGSGILGTSMFDS